MQESIKRSKESNSRRFYQTQKQMFEKDAVGSRLQNVKTVQIFIDKLDRQINDSYKKLKKNRQKMSEKKQQSTFLEQTLPHAYPSVSQEHQESKYYVTNISSPGKQTLKSNAEDQDIVLLDNKDVMEYIYLVYDRYNIKDPLEDGGEDANRYMTNKKIRRFKDKLQRQIGSASTMKNSELYKSVQLNPFPEMKKALAKKQHTSGAKIEVVSLMSKNQSRNTSNEKNQELNRNNLTSYRLKNENIISKKQKINITAFKSQQVIPQPTAAVASVPQLFRFCFMCEEPILQCNLILHEKTCESLKKALEFTFDQILQILDDKIKRLMEEVNDQLLEKTEQRIKEEFKTIKMSVRNWLNQLPKEPVGTSSRTNMQKSSLMTKNENWRGQFNKIEQNITNSVCSSFHLLHKLQWFSKLRDNIIKKFTIK